MSQRRRVPSALVIAAVSLAIGCKYLRPVDPNRATQPADQPARVDTARARAAERAPEPGQPAGRARLQLSDANIAAMVLAANNTDISYARLVPSRAERADVKEFAQRMLTDHTGVNGLVNDLLATLNLAPVENTASLDFRDESATRRDAMRDLTAWAFDSTYIENEVAYHQKFLATIDNVLLPAAKHADLRALLTAVRPAVANHLAHAEQVRANVLSRR
jgi:putative membrane protein